jgi:hypothetical protein
MEDLLLSDELEEPVRFTLDQSLDVLRRTPATLGALLRGVGEGWARGTEGPDTFSAFDVVGHLIDGEETDWMVRVRIILARVMAKQYREEVGPWVPFLPVLTDHETPRS